MEAAGLSLASIQKALAALKRAFNLAVQAGKLPHRPHIPSVKIDNVRTHFVSEADYQAVQIHLPPDEQDVVEWLYLTGMRVGEALQMRWADVDFNAGVVVLRPGTTKNRGGRVFPFGALPELEELLLRRSARSSEYPRSRVDGASVGLECSAR